MMNRELTEKEKKVITAMRRDFEFKKEMTDEEILAQARFVDFGPNFFHDEKDIDEIDEIEEI